ncbi:adipokinetic hormone/corazonin-related peptide receptor variant I-like [Culicoides brevitarsis]|uniref:adipokinetic hormone/corazonin-related peptide receptor variant I-like n=1 Tax=Culicoides brevitarsis TaxID=469753 RepID=UPI00307C76E7
METEENDARKMLFLRTSTRFLNNTSFENIFNETKNISLSISTPGYTESTIPVIVSYCILFIIAGGGNISVVVTLFRSKRHRRSRVSLMIFNLAVADLMVALVMIPLEVGWRITVEWQAGNFACKAFSFARAFCLYLSSNVLVCVSLDRCFAVIYPLRVSAARRRGKLMLTCAWLIALVYAFPQSIIFHVKEHPQIPGFTQCVTFGSFSNQIMETAYNLFCMIAMYFLPLIIISIAYSFILCEIANRSKEKGILVFFFHFHKIQVNTPTTTSALRLRCNDISHIERARQRTLRLTITIVCGFVCCWTPYAFMTLWYMFDRESALKVDNTVQDGLFIMAVSNSCVNPLIYGSYAMKCQWWPCFNIKTKTNKNGDKVMLQRRSTDGGSGAHSDRLLTNREDNNDSKSSKDKYYKNNIAIVPVQFKASTSRNNRQLIQYGVTDYKCNNFYKDKNCRLNEKSKKGKYPSLGEITLLEERPPLIFSGLSFHSDPIPHKYESDMDSGLTKSIDTEPIFEQHEIGT